MERELLFEGKENVSSINIKEFSAEGAKVDITLAGKISGKVTGLIMTTHNALMKPDGSGDVDLRSIISPTASQSSYLERPPRNS